jgi:hypothetical protein
MTIVNGYCTLAEVKAALRLENSDTKDDALLENTIEGASRRIDGECGRFFYKTAPTAVSIMPRNEYYIMLDDIATTTNLVVKTDTTGNGVFDTTWTLGVDYIMEPTNALVIQRPYRRISAIGAKTFPLTVVPNPPTTQVTAQWGFDSIPFDIREATVLLAMRGFARYNSALGVVGFGDMAITVRSVDPDIRDMIDPYRLLAVA